MSEETKSVTPVSKVIQFLVFLSGLETQLATCSQYHPRERMG